MQWRTPPTSSPLNSLLRLFICLLLRFLVSPSISVVFLATLLILCRAVSVSFPHSFLVLSLSPHFHLLLALLTYFSLCLIPICPPAFCISHPFYTSIICVSLLLCTCNIVMLPLGIYNVQFDFHKIGDRENYQVLS